MAARTPAHDGSSRLEDLVPVFAAALPGAIAGIQLAGLLFFLNPQWPFAPLPLLRSMAFYGALLAALTLALTLPFTWRRARRARRWLPWALTVVFAAAGITHFVHAWYYSLYLPGGINLRLIKAGIWLSLAGLICFYTALVHATHQRPYGRRSRIGIALLCLLTSYVILERREAYRPPPEPAPRPAAIDPTTQPDLIVLGIESASLDVVLPLVEQDRLPFLGELQREGSAGRLRTVRPTRRVPAWATLATGKLPFRHGALSRERYRADLVAAGAEFSLLPVGLSFERWGVPGGALPGGGTAPTAARPLWEILESLGYDALVLGWPGYRPERGVHGIALRDLRGELPPALELDGWSRPLAPEDSESPLGRRDRWLLEAASLWLAERPRAERPMALFLHLPDLGPISLRTFGGYSAVRFGGSRRPGDLDAARDLETYYESLDGALAQLRERSPAAAGWIVASAYGVAARSAVRRLFDVARPGLRTAGTLRGNPDGLVVLAGGGYRAGARLHDLAITDLVPTLLYGVGLPVAADLDGEARTAAFRPETLAERPLTFVPSYETESVRSSGP